MNLDPQLGQLVTEQLVHASRDHGDEYTFKHALTQETVYRSLLKSQRRALHRAVAEAIEKTFPERKGKLSDVLGFHWEQADVPDRARRYLFRAAQNALRQYANQEALALLERALALSADAKPDEVMALRESRAQVYEFLSQYDRAIEDYQAALPLARSAKLEIDECRIMSRIAWLYSLSGRGADAVAMASESETRARALQDESVALRAYLVQGMVAQADGDLAYAYPRLRRALFASRARDEKPLEGEALFYLGIQNNFMGRFGRAAACARKAYDIKKGLSDRVGEIVSLYLLARAEAGRGNYDAALDALEAGRVVSEETRNPFGLAQYPNTRAWLDAELGDWESAYARDLVGLDIAKRAPVRPPEISVLINLVNDCTMLGKLDEADAHRAELAQWMDRPEFGFHAWRWQTRLADASARLEFARGRVDDAEKQIATLFALTARTRSAKYRARGLILQADVHRARGETIAAENCLITARELADALGYLPARIHARRALTRIGKPAPDLDQLVADARARLQNAELAQAFARGISQARDLG
ncbi:MAG: hypothetical protein HZC40_05155 [Chloroflexi bacterium]|nr:hypothetical protein [Chloroflexota bacterium]